jgi:hypothetical protein
VKKVANDSNIVLHNVTVTMRSILFLALLTAATLAAAQTGPGAATQQPASAAGQGGVEQPRQPPPPTDVDPKLTEELRRLELELGEAALHGFKDTKTMERLVSPEFVQRVSDVPERSLPRSLWGQPSSAYKIESLEQHHHAARRLSEDLAVVSLLLSQKATVAGRDRSGDFYIVDIWKKSADRWRLIGRYSSPVGKKLDRSPQH